MNDNLKQDGNYTQVSVEFTSTSPAKIDLMIGGKVVDSVEASKLMQATNNDHCVTVINQRAVELRSNHGR